MADIDSERLAAIVAKLPHVTDDDIRSLANEHSRVFHRVWGPVRRQLLDGGVSRLSVIEVGDAIAEQDHEAEQVRAESLAKPIERQSFFDSLAGE